MQCKNGDFTIRPRDGNENVKNRTIDLVAKTTTLHVHLTFLYISLPFLHDYDVKLPNLTFSGGRKQATTKFYSLSILEYGSQKFNSGRVHLH